MRCPSGAKAAAATAAHSGGWDGGEIKNQGVVKRVIDVVFADVDVETCHQQWNELLRDE